MWKGSADLPTGAVYEYKYVLVDFETKQALQWQGGGNCVLAIADEDKKVIVSSLIIFGPSRAFLFLLSLEISISILPFPMHTFHTFLRQPIPTFLFSHFFTHRWW